MTQRILAFFADGPRWDNVVLVPALPAGYSYPRAFRYRDGWIEPDVLMSLRNQPPTSPEQNIVLCMRFIDTAHQWTVVPIRLVTVTYLSASADETYVYFRLGPLFRYDGSTDIASAASVISPQDQDRVGQKLLFDVTEELFSVASFGDEPSPWSRLVDSVATTSLPINNLARRSCFLQVQVFRNGSVAPVGQVGRPAQRGPLFGATLREGSDYDLQVDHRIPCLIGTTTGFSQASLHYKFGSSDLELEKTVDYLTANYDRHMVVVRPREASAPRELAIVPDTFTDRAGQNVEGAAVQLPLGITRSLAYRFSRTYRWVLLLWLFLAMSALATGYQAMGGEIGKDPKYYVAVAVFTGFSSLGVWLLQNRPLS